MPRHRTIREALVGVSGEDADSVDPIIAVLEREGFNVDAEVAVSRAFLRLQPVADFTQQLNLRQRKVLEVVITAEKQAGHEPAGQGSAAEGGNGAILATLNAILATMMEDRKSLTKLLLEKRAVRGPGSAAAGGLERPAEVYHNVSRLTCGGETVGAVCMIAFRGRVLLLTARHCLDPQPGQTIDNAELALKAFAGIVEGWAMNGFPLRHIASFPGYDVSVLEFEHAEAVGALRQKNVLPLALERGHWVGLGWPVSVAGFPLAAEQEFPGVAQSPAPVVSHGAISWLDMRLHLAGADYGAAPPSSSGGAVVLTDFPTALYGLHLGTGWHEEGRRPGGGVQPLQDQRAGLEPGGSGGGGGGGDSAAGLGAMPIDTVETRQWTGEQQGDMEGGAGAAQAKRKHCFDNL